MEDFNILEGVIKKDGKSLFDSKIEKELLEIKDEKERLDKEVQKYDQIVAILDRLPHELGWPIPFLPVTNHAFLPNAMLTNSNEVQVHIGDGWFTRCSAHHAKGICQRRQQKCRTTKLQLEEREKLLLPWLHVAQGKGGIAGGHEREEQEEGDGQEAGPGDAFSADEVVEFVSEEQYLADKEAHEQKAREHYLRQRELKKQQQQQQQMSDEELWARLEELEMKESSCGELRVGAKVATQEVLRTQGGAGGLSEEEQGRAAKKGAVRFAEVGSTEEVGGSSSGNIQLGWNWDDADGNESESEESSESETSVNSKEENTEAKDRPRKLSFAEHIKTGSDETSVIEFAHTPVESLPAAAAAATRTAAGVPESPSDIYTTYHELFAAAVTTPKSILKRRSQGEMDETWPAVSYPCIQYEPDLARDEQLPLEDEPQVLVDIVEKQATPQASVHETPQPQQKKMSKFKSARMASKQSPK